MLLGPAAGAHLGAPDVVPRLRAPVVESLSQGAGGGGIHCLAADDWLRMQVMVQYLGHRLRLFEGLISFVDVFEVFFELIQEERSLSHVGL